MNPSEIKGREAVQQHFQELFFGYPVTVISVQDQLQHALNAYLNSTIIDLLITEAERRDTEEGA